MTPSREAKKKADLLIGLFPFARQLLERKLPEAN